MDAEVGRRGRRAGTIFLIVRHPVPELDGRNRGHLLDRVSYRTYGTASLIYRNAGNWRRS
jgi:hypothetical protein